MIESSSETLSHGSHTFVWKCKHDLQSLIVCRRSSEPELDLTLACVGRFNSLGISSRFIKLAYDLLLGSCTHQAVSRIDRWEIYTHVHTWVYTCVHMCVHMCTHVCTCAWYIHSIYHRPLDMHELVATATSSSVRECHPDVSSLTCSNRDTSDELTKCLSQL